MVPEASPSPPAPGEREGAESASALVEALEAMRQCKEVALQASRRLFARGLRDGPTPARQRRRAYSSPAPPRRNYCLADRGAAEHCPTILNSAKIPS